MSDNINPDHYQGGIECIDAIEEALTSEEFAGFCKGNIFKYIWRCNEKGGIEDLLKAKWYLDRLIESAKQSDLQSLKDYPFGEPSDKPPKPAFAIGDRVRVCRHNSALDGCVCEIDNFLDDEKILVLGGERSGVFHSSELQSVEAAK